METSCHSRRRPPLSRCGALGLAAVLLLGACASAPEPPQSAAGVELEQYAETAAVNPAPRGVYTPSLRQVAYVPQSSDAALEVEEGPGVASEPTEAYFASTEQLASAAADNDASSVQIALGQTTDEDPWEGLNRYFYDLNSALDYLIFRQFAEAYRLVVPDGVRRSVTNFVRFVKTPVILANDLLQGDLDRAGNTTSRFVVNAAIGFGLFDVASDSGLPYQEQDFGQTLAVWGVDSGPYVVLPLLGPSTARDGVGIGVDILLDPLTYVLSQEESLARWGIEALEARERNLDTLDEIRRDALDEYARVRSLYLQNRRDTIEKGRARNENEESADKSSRETADSRIYQSDDHDGFLRVDVHPSM